MSKIDWKAWKLGFKHAMEVNGDLNRINNPYKRGTVAYNSYLEGFKKY